MILINSFERFQLKFCSKICQFQPSAAYKIVAYKTKSVYNKLRNITPYTYFSQLHLPFWNKEPRTILGSEIFNPYHTIPYPPPITFHSDTLTGRKSCMMIFGFYPSPMRPLPFRHSKLDYHLRGTSGQDYSGSSLSRGVNHSSKKWMRAKSFRSFRGVFERFFMMYEFF